MERFVPPFMLWVALVFGLSSSLPAPAVAQDEGGPAAGISSGAIPEPFESDDKDLKIADGYFTGVVVSSATIVGFGAGAVAAGVESFILASSTAGQTSSQHLFAGLTLVSLGSASLASGISGIESRHRSWKALRRAMWNASPSERRLLRAREVMRLRSRTRSHAMGVAADSTFLGLGIAMSLLGPPGQALPLVINGAFVLGLDIFQLILDDQTARAWERRSEEASSGFFGRAPRPGTPRILAVGLTPLPVPRGEESARAGLALSLAGVF